MSVGIQVSGGTVESIVAASEAVMKILSSDKESEVLKAALDTLRRMTSVEGTTISGCTVHADPVK